MLDKIKHYFLETLWNFSLREKTGKRRFFLKILRIAFLSVRGFIQDQCSLRASSLTYYTTMSIVPLFALAFFIAGGFGLYEKFREQILIRFPEQKEIFTELFKYADTLLDQTRGGIVASFGVIVLVFTVILLLSNLEGILNHIWGVKKLRTWWRIFTDYLALMVFAPIFYVVANSLSIFIVEELAGLIRELPLSSMAIGWLVFLINLIPYCLFWILFTVMYFFMPNTKVQLRSALLAGIFAGTLYLIVQWGYIYFQVGVSRYGAIYGSVTAIPLLLVWLQISWSLFLFGAELSYAHQTLEEHEYEKPIGQLSDRLKKLISLWILYLAIDHKVLTLEILTKEKIPKGLSKLLLRELVDCELLERDKNQYTPTERLSHARISDCLEMLETKGVNQFPFFKSEVFSSLELAMHEFETLVQSSPKNMRLKDVSHPT